MTHFQGQGYAGDVIEPTIPVNYKLNIQVLFRQALYRLFCSGFLYPDEEMLVDLQKGVRELLNSSVYWNKYAFAEKLHKLISKKIQDHDHHDFLA